MTRRRAFAALACAAVAATVAGVAMSEPTRSQTFFEDRLIADRATAAQVRSALREGSVFVEKAIVFVDLTGDGKDDAVVRVQSGGAGGAVAVYVFSTDGPRDDQLRAVYRSQKLTRASTTVRDDVLFVRSAAYAPGDDLCCPTRLVETELEWADDRFRAKEPTDVTPPEAP